MASEQEAQRQQWLENKAIADRAKARNRGHTFQAPYMDEMQQAGGRMVRCAPPPHVEQPSN